MNKFIVIIAIVSLSSCNKEPIELRDYKANSCFNLETQIHDVRQIGLNLFKDDSGVVTSFPTEFHSWSDIISKRAVKLIGAIDTARFKTHSLYLEFREKEDNFTYDLISISAWLDVKSKEQVVYFVIDNSYTDQEEHGLLCYYWILKPPAGYKMKRIFKYI